MQPMSCLTLIRSARDQMSANEKKLADFILENASLIRDYSSQQIAGSVGVSQSSVVKFSQKIGYKGFTDLKLAIHESVVKHNSNVAILRDGKSMQSGASTLREQLYHSKCEALGSVTELNDDETLEAAVNAVNKAVRVELVGRGNASLIAQDFAFKLMSIGVPCIAVGDTQLQLSGVATLQSGDCLVIVSGSGQAPDLVRVAKKARDAGVTVVSLTSQSANPIRALADVRLFTLSNGGKFDMPAVITAACQQHVLDVLFYMLTKRKGRLSDPETIANIESTGGK